MKAQSFNVQIKKLNLHVASTFSKQTVLYQLQLKEKLASVIMQPSTTIPYVLRNIKAKQFINGKLHNSVAKLVTRNLQASRSLKCIILNLSN